MSETSRSSSSVQSSAQTSVAHTRSQISSVGVPAQGHINVPMVKSGRAGKHTPNAAHKRAFGPPMIPAYLIPSHFPPLGHQSPQNRPVSSGGRHQLMQGGMPMVHAMQHGVYANSPHSHNSPRMSSNQPLPSKNMKRNKKPNKSTVGNKPSVAGNMQIEHMPCTNLHRLFTALTPRFKYSDERHGMFVASVDEREIEFGIQQKSDKMHQICCRGGDVSDVHTPLSSLWRHFADPFGHEVHLTLDSAQSEHTSEQPVYFVPFLSALFLYSSSSIDTSNAETSQPSEFKIEFIERQSVHARVPFYDTILSLAAQHPFLMDSCLCQLDRQKSWMSVAWYPVMNDLYTNHVLGGSFLVYHRFSLSPICPARNFPIQRNPTNVTVETSANSSTAALHPAEIVTSIDSSLPIAVDASSSSTVPLDQEQNVSQNTIDASSLVEIEVPATTAPIKEPKLAYCRCPNSNDGAYYLSLYGLISHNVHAPTWFLPSQLNSNVMHKKTVNLQANAPPKALCDSVKALFKETHVRHHDYEQISLSKV